MVILSGLIGASIGYLLNEYITRQKIHVECDSEGYKWLIVESDSYVAANPYHEATILQLIRENADKNKTLIDIGAHQGYFSVRCAGYFDTVYAIEPNKYNRTLLETNLALNNIQNVKIIPYALYSSDSVLTLKARSGESYISELIGDLSDEESLEIEAITLDALINANNINASSISTIKIDVEGAEVEILKGATDLISQADALWIIENHEFIYNLAGQGNKIKSFFNDYTSYDIVSDNKMIFWNR